MPVPRSGPCLTPSTPCSSIGRASDSDSEGFRFDSGHGCFAGPVAQSVALPPLKREVEGSNPSGSVPTGGSGRNTFDSDRWCFCVAGAGQTSGMYGAIAQGRCGGLDTRWLGCTRPPTDVANPRRRARERRLPGKPKWAAFLLLSCSEVLSCALRRCASSVSTSETRRYAVLATEESRNRYRRVLEATPFRAMGQEGPGTGGGGGKQDPVEPPPPPPPPPDDGSGG